MKIIFANRKNCLSSSGGDTIQMMKTIEYLQKNFDIESKICLEPDEIINDKECKIVHIFNIQTIDDTLALIKASKQVGKKVVLSTVYWDLSHHVYMHKMFQLTKNIDNMKFYKIFKDAFIKGAYFRQYIPKNKNIDSYATKKYIEKRRKALLEADIILPNSSEELSILSKEFDIDIDVLSRKASVIPNAVDIHQEKTTNKIDILNGLDNFVLNVGRIEVNKNQYGIVNALFDRPDIPIVFIGRVNEHKVDIEYYNKVKELSERRGNVFFINQISQNEVFEYYKKARVHVLPSFRDSPGLSSLEALYFGCEIVTSSEQFCPIDYYKFNEKAHVCNPYSFQSIKNAVLSAYNNPKNLKFDEEYFKHYSYDNVSRLMKITYDKLAKANDLNT